MLNIVLLFGLLSMVFLFGCVSNSVIPTGSNVALNSGFESGIIPWTFYTTGSGSIARVSTEHFEGSSSAMITISAVADNTQLYQPALVLDPGARYRLSFAAKSIDGDDFDVFVQKHSSPFTMYGLSWTDVDVTTSWKVFSKEFTASGFSSQTSDARLRFWFVGNTVGGSKYFIDNVSMIKLSAVQVCVPGSPPSCNSASAIRLCNADGSGFIVTNCAAGQVCINGGCGIPHECTVDSGCNDNLATTADSCVGNRCVHTSVCRGYESPDADVCVLDVAKLFVPAGISDFYADEPVKCLAFGFLVVAIIGLVLYYFFRKN